MIALALIPIFVRLSTIDPIATATWRLILAIPFLSFGAKKITLPPERKGYLMSMVALAGILFGADIALLHASITLTSISNASFLSSLFPIFVAILAALFLKEKVSPGLMLGIFVSLVGAFIMVWGNWTYSPHQLWGDFLAFLATFTYSVYLVMVRWLRQYVASLPLLFWSGFASILLLIPLSLVYESQFIPNDFSGWLPLIGLAIVGHGLGQGGLTLSMGYLPAAFVALILLLAPIISTLAGWILLGESISLYVVMGAALILLGLSIGQRSKMS